MDVREAGKKGGENTFRKHGKLHMRKLGKKGGYAKAQKNKQVRAK